MYRLKLRLAFCTALAATLAVGSNAVAIPVVLSFGANGQGQTGLNVTSGATLVATPIDATNLVGRSISQIAAGYSHSLLLADDASVFSFGGPAGILGLGTTGADVAVATPIVATNLSGKTIAQVAVGGVHSLLLADDGTVFSFGDHNDGRLGRVGNRSLAEAINATQLAGKKITQVAAGGAHSLLLADDGTVFSFGYNLYGQTGLGIASETATPVATPIDATNLGGKKITQVAAGHFHSLLLADDGTVFSFGENYSGELGLGFASETATPIATPIDATNLGGRKITQVSAGSARSLVLTEDGTVFSFGLAGGLGLGTITAGIPVATPIDATNLGGKKITQVDAGWYHSLLLADDGTVFSFGADSYGELGLGVLGQNAEIATPILTTNLAGMTVTQIAAGDQFSLLLAAPAATTQPGDFNHDGVVDGSDFLLWQRGHSPDPLGAADLAAWRTHFGQTLAAGAAVPEPGAVALAVVALPSCVHITLRPRRRGRSILGETRPRRPSVN